MFEQVSKFVLSILNEEKMKTLSQKLNISMMVFAMSITSILGLAQTNPATLKSKGLAPVNGIKMYYEIHGEGKPIVLLHGAYMTINLNWGQLIPEFAKNRKVIVFELQGHGHTELTKRPYSYMTMATDVAQALKHLKIESADIVGYSFGGTVAYQLAFQNPELVKSLTIISSVYKYVGWQSEVRDVLKTMKPEFLSNTPLRTDYVATAPDSSKWNEFLSKMIAFDLVDFNLGEDKVKNLKMPVLLISGDNDGVDKTILFQTYKTIGGGVFADMAGFPKSQLAILPSKGHVSLMMETQGVYNYINAFLK